MNAKIYLLFTTRPKFRDADSLEAQANFLTGSLLGSNNVMIPNVLMSI